MENNKIGIFQSANQFLLPATQLLDFFDFLATEKLYLPNQQQNTLQKQLLYYKFASKSLKLSPPPAKNMQNKPSKITKIQNTLRDFPNQKQMQKQNMVNNRKFNQKNGKTRYQSLSPTDQNRQYL